MPSILITGANRGIGLAFARRAASEGWRVIATCRDPDRARELRAIDGDITVHALDVADRAAIEALAGALAGMPIDILLNNAGISAGDGGGRFGAIDYESWEEVLRVNTIAPMKMAECFADNVARSERRLIVCITSRMGSIAEAYGGYYQYRSSKAALNMVAANLAGDLSSRGITVVVFHPGWVRTNMGGRSAPLTPDDSVAGMWRVIGGLSQSDSGAFLNYDGGTIPW